MTPERIFIKVDLPAPFSPATACTRPLSKVTETPRSACAPPNHLSIPVSLAAGGRSATDMVSLHGVRGEPPGILLGGLGEIVLVDVQVHDLDPRDVLQAVVDGEA